MKQKIMIVAVTALVFLIASCASSTSNVGTLTLPSSNKVIDVVQHRSDSHECSTLVVLQTFDSEGKLIDSQQGRGQAFHCGFTFSLIEGGSRVGSAALIADGMVRAARATAPDTITVEGSKASASANPVASSSSAATSNAAAKAASSSAASAQASQNQSSMYWDGGKVIKGPKGNNGKGNGGDDGSPNGKEDETR